MKRVAETCLVEINFNRNKIAKAIDLNIIYLHVENRENFNNNIVDDVLTFYSRPSSDE